MNVLTSGRVSNPIALFILKRGEWDGVLGSARTVVDRVTGNAANVSLAMDPQVVAPGQTVAVHITIKNGLSPLEMRGVLFEIEAVEQINLPRNADWTNVIADVAVAAAKGQSQARRRRRTQPIGLAIIRGIRMKPAWRSLLRSSSPEPRSGSSRDPSGSRRPAIGRFQRRVALFRDGSVHPAPRGVVQSLAVRTLAAWACDDANVAREVGAPRRQAEVRSTPPYQICTPSR
jgi:hypothetical protein